MLIKTIEQIQESRKSPKKTVRTSEITNLSLVETQNEYRVLGRNTSLSHSSNYLPTLKLVLTKVQSSEHELTHMENELSNTENALSNTVNELSNTVNELSNTLRRLESTENELSNTVRTLGAVVSSSITLMQLCQGLLEDLMTLETWVEENSKGDNRLVVLQSLDRMIVLVIEQLIPELNSICNLG